MKYIILAFFVIFSAQDLKSEPKYVVSEIPKSLLNNAKAVIRKSDIQFKIYDIDNADLTETFAITILNINGLDKSVLGKFYDKFSSVRNMKVSVYDKSGNEVHSGFNTQADDFAALSDFSLYEDLRVKILNPKYASLPFTVEFSYSISYKGMINYPIWYVYDDYNISVQNAAFTVDFPKAFKVRYLERNLASGYKGTYNLKRTAYTWTATNMPALKNEPFSSPLPDISPGVFLGPYDFEINGIRGNSSNWAEFGNWIWHLNKDRNNLPDATVEKLKAIVSSSKSDYEAVQLLYNYMQSKVRYANIQQGIGGWQPIEAKSVDKVSYGDCKALANYMKSMLDAVGIKSFYTLVKAGENAPQLIQDFPSNQFNHAIVCVPFGKDTIWLECTDQLIPFGFLGKFTDNRRALIICDTIGKVVKTREYTISDNSLKRKITVRLESDGYAQLSAVSDYRGLTYDSESSVLRIDDLDKKKKIIESLGLSRVDLKGFKYTEKRDTIPSVKEELTFDVPDYGVISGKSIMFKPNIISRLSAVPQQSAIRKSPVLIRRSYTESDTVIYILPVGYHAENFNISDPLRTKFGEYSSSILSVNNKLTYIRNFKLFKGTYLPSEYNSLVDFFEYVQLADNKQIIVNQ